VNLEDDDRRGKSDKSQVKRVACDTGIKSVLARQLYETSQPKIGYKNGVCLSRPMKEHLHGHVIRHYSKTTNSIFSQTEAKATLMSGECEPATFGYKIPWTMSLEPDLL
jgi:hypothetical protein